MWPNQSLTLYSRKWTITCFCRCLC